MKNSSRLLAKIARKFARSRSGRARVLGEFEDPLVEREPAALPVEEPALRELDTVLHRVLVRVEVGVEVGLQVGDVRRHGVRAVRGYGADGGLRVLDLCLGVGLAHEPILPRRGRNGRVGESGRERARVCGLPFSLTGEGSCSGGGEGSGAAGFIA